MKIKKLIFGFVVMLSFIGCGNTLPSIISKDTQYTEALRYTKKTTFDISLEEKALFIATYLNPLEKKGDGEYFFVRTFIDNDFEEAEKAGLHHPGVKITLNGKPPVQIRELKKEDILVKQMPFTQQWYRYYLVRFPKQKQSQLKFTISFDDYGQKVLLFLKPIEQ
ncbi:hypothetical protein [Nitratiruptor sp. SB155-2]|uniref:hypothetical protein n=1 Tax=Nitratiruptor sp. (strain SB155-2) TaxID=387092 RepID=UPI0001587414|nr:hypothetical protein [Nitratiruptor sp. SB155-2]BAF69910.1 conserved hypothetical protein [Nitratiruptor sp. SB155-2]